MKIELSHFEHAYECMQSTNKWPNIAKRCVFLVRHTIRNHSARSAAATFVRMAFEQLVQPNEQLDAECRAVWDSAFEASSNVQPMSAAGVDEWTLQICAGVGSLIAEEFDVAYEYFKLAFDVRSDDRDLWCDVSRLWAVRLESDSGKQLEFQLLQSTSAHWIEIGERFLSASDEHAGAICARLGRILLALDRFEEAHSMLQRAALLQPNDVWTHWMLLDALLCAGAAQQVAAEVLRAARARGVEFGVSDVDELELSTVPVVAAVHRNRPGLVELLLSEFEDGAPQLLRLALLTAAKLGRCAVIEILCKRDCFLMVDDAIDAAIGHGRLDAMRLLCELPSVGYSAKRLSSAIRSLHVDVPAFDDNGASLEARKRAPSCTPACEAMRSEMIQFLMSKGCSLTQPLGFRSRERSPLATAARAGCLPTVRLLWELSGHSRTIIFDDMMNSSADWNGHSFNSPVSRAAMSGDAAVLEALVDWGGVYREFVALTIKFAIELERIEIVRWLQARALIWPTIAWSGRRAICHAAEHNLREVVHMLAVAGANPDNDGIPTSFSEAPPYTQESSMQKLAIWSRADSVLLLLAAAPGEIAKCSWLRPHTAASALCCTESFYGPIESAFVRRIGALFIAAGAPQTREVRELIQANDEVRTSIEQAAVDLERERRLAHRTWFALVGFRRVTDVALALNALQLPTLVVCEILAFEETRFASVPCVWLWERIERVRKR